MCTVNNAEIDKICFMRCQHCAIVGRHLRHAKLSGQGACLISAVRACTEYSDLDPICLTQCSQRFPRDHTCTDNCHLHFNALLHLRNLDSIHSRLCHPFIITGSFHKEKGLPQKQLLPQQTPLQQCERMCFPYFIILR